MISHLRLSKPDNMFLVVFRLNGKSPSKSSKYWLGDFSFIIVSKSIEVLIDDIKHLKLDFDICWEIVQLSLLVICFLLGILLIQHWKLGRPNCDKKSGALSAKSGTTKFILGKLNSLMIFSISGIGLFTGFSIENWIDFKK